jgi:hypothetical protein
MCDDYNYLNVFNNVILWNNIMHLIFFKFNFKKIPVILVKL